MNGPTTTEETHHLSNVLKHYAHAKEKHPYFCDKFTDLSAKTWRFRDEQMRRSIKNCINSGTGVPAEHVIMSEFAEAFSAIANGNMSNAVEELYDTIAVCLRTIDVLKGWQKLGKPATKGETT